MKRIILLLMVIGLMSCDTMFYNDGVHVIKRARIVVKHEYKYKYLVRIRYDPQPFVGGTSNYDLYSNTLYAIGDTITPINW